MVIRVAGHWRKNTSINGQISAGLAYWSMLLSSWVSLGGVATSQRRPPIHVASQGSLSFCVTFAVLFRGGIHWQGLGLSGCSEQLPFLVAGVLSWCTMLSKPSLHSNVACLTCYPRLAGALDVPSCQHCNVTPPDLHP